MVSNPKSKAKVGDIQQIDTDEEKITRLKNSIYEILFQHLKQNETAIPYPYYFFVFLEQLGLLWFIIRPGLMVFGNDVYLLPQMINILKIFNFYEYLNDNPSLYQIMVLAVFSYLVLHIIIISISIFGILNESDKQFFKYIKSIANLQFILNAKVLSGPFMGLTVNVLYCSNSNPSHVATLCYQSLHLVFCVLSAIILTIVIAEILLFACFYFLKNPLTTSYLGEQNRYYTLSKSILKLIFPVYYAMDFELTLSVAFTFMAAGLWGTYIFWHRLFSTHSYQQNHFYIEYLMEGVVFWMAINNILSNYIEGRPTIQEMSFIFALFSAILIGILLVNIEQTAENKLIQECLENKVKKQNMERFVFILVNRFLHYPAQEAKLTFRVYSKILAKNIEDYSESNEEFRNESNQMTDKQEIYHFLCVLIQSYISEYNSIILKTLKCYLLCSLGKKSYGLHQSLQLQEQRLGLVDEFMLFQFRKIQDIFANQNNEKVSREFVKFYRFHQELGILEELITFCAENNLQYWDELVESDPSVVKLRNLATLYCVYSAKISKQYSILNDVFPQSLSASSLYLSFLLSVGVDIKEALKIKEKVASIQQSRSRSIQMLQNEISQDEQISIITLDSIGGNLGIILNCNSHLQELLGYEKNSIMGKNVTKIMPKVYSELHNEFMLKFIRSEHSHNRPSDKIVTALNNAAELIEVKLTVRMMTSKEHSLVVVGFLKKLPQQYEKGLIMCQMGTGEILGVNENLLKIINNRLTGKKIVQDEMKLQGLMPELNLEYLENQTIQNTILQFGSISQTEGVDFNMTKTVVVQLKSVKLYQGIKIGFLQVNQSSKTERSSLKKKSNSSVSKKRSGKRRSKKSCDIEIDIHKIENFQAGNTTIQISKQLMSPENDVTDMTEQDISRLSKQTLIARKVEEHIKSKQGKSIVYLVYLLYALGILGCSTLTLYIYFSHNSYLDSMQDVYNEMNQTTFLTYFESQVNMNADYIWNIQANAYRSANTSGQIPLLSQSIQAFSSTYYSILTNTKKYPQNLLFNQPNYYNFTFAARINNTFNQSIVQQTCIDGFNNYLMAATLISQQLPATPQNKNFLQLQALFVRNNGDELIPSISMRLTNLYNSLAISLIQGQFIKLTSQKMVLLGLSLVVMVGIAFIGSYINKINVQMISMYRKVRLWDINELSFKCNKFLELKAAKPMKTRGSSLLKIFPLRTLVNIIETQKIIEQSQSMSKSFNHAKEEKSLKDQSFKSIKDSQSVKQSKFKQLYNTNNEFRECMSPDNLLSPNLATPFEVADGNDYEQTMLKGVDSEPMVHVEQETATKMIVVGILLCFLLFGGVVAISVYMQQANCNAIEDQILRLNLIGQLRTSLNYICYYASRIINVPNNNRIRTLLNQEIFNFYTISSQTYPYLGDPNPVLKEVYTYVQTIQQWLAVPNVTAGNIILSTTYQLYLGLTQGSSDINTLNQQLFGPQYTKTLSNDNQDEQIFALVLILVSFILVLLLHYLYIDPIYTQAKHSLNMLKILPAWIFQRNGEALHLIQ